MSSPSGVLAVFLCSSLFGSCHAMALTTNMATKAWSKLDEVSEPTDHNLPSDLPMWTALAGGAKMAATASPLDLWTPPSVNAEEMDMHNVGSQGAVAQPSSEFKSAQSVMEEGTLHFSEPHGHSLEAGTDQLVNSQSDWADEDHMSDIYIRQTEGDLTFDTSSLASQTPQSSVAPQDRSLMDTGGAATTAPDRSSVTPDTGMSIPALTLDSDAHGPAARDDPDTGLDPVAMKPQGAGTEVMTSVLHEEDVAIRPTEEASLITDSFRGRHFSRVKLFDAFQWFPSSLLSNIIRSPCSKSFPCCMGHGYSMTGLGTYSRAPYMVSSTAEDLRDDSLIEVL